jgi:hypothetical protein
MLGERNVLQAQEIGEKWPFFCGALLSNSLGYN